MMKLESRPPETDPLAQLDAELDAERICECACDMRPNPHGKKPCQKQATHYVEVHLFAVCRHPSSLAHPDVNADGDRCQYLCENCLQANLANAQLMLSKLPPRAVCPPPPAGCGCGRPAATIEDVVPVRRPL